MTREQLIAHNEALQADHDRMGEEMRHMAAEAQSATAPIADSEAWLAQNPLYSFATTEDAIHSAYKAGQLHHVNARVRLRSERGSTCVYKRHR